MTTEIDVIKENLYEKIAEIDNVQILMAMQTIIENIEKNDEDQYTNKEDFTGYIKEWVKNM